MSIALGNLPSFGRTGGVPSCWFIHLHRNSNRDIAQRHAQQAFTLVELLVVISIIAVLMGMASSILTVAKRQSMRTNTEVTMRKVATALRMFQRDNGVLPFQANYPIEGPMPTVTLVQGANDYPASISPAAPFPNLLARRLGHSLTGTEIDTFNTVCASAAEKYEFVAPIDGDNRFPEQLGSALTYRQSYTLSQTQFTGDYDANDPYRARCIATYLNRFGAARARLAVRAGALDLDGPLIVGPTMTTPKMDLTTVALLSGTETKGMATGWCDDYLDGCMQPKDIRGDAVVDAWGYPLVYIAMVIPRSRGVSMQRVGHRIKSQDLAWYGMGVTGFRANSGPWAEILATKRWRLLQNGRVTVGDIAVDGQPAPVCTGNPGQPMASDRRWFAAPGYEQDFELWSTGPDGNFGWTRNDPANRDNVPFQPYDRSIQ